MPSGYFLKIDRGGQTLHISGDEMVPIRAFSVLQKWPQIAKMNFTVVLLFMTYGPYIMDKFCEVSKIKFIQ